MATTLYPYYSLQLVSVEQKWTNIRPGDGSYVDTFSSSPLKFQQYITSPTPPNSFVFARSYISFDLRGIDSSTDPIISIKLFVWGTTVTGQRTYIGYSGNFLSRTSNENWRLYLDNINGNGDPLSTVVVESEKYISCDLDIATYPPTIPIGQNFYDVYVIGLITENDFTNNIDSTDGLVEIDNDANPPYIVINGGYANNIIGVPGASIITVSGVPSADITNIMGV
jgi:hypothetical protein